MLSGGWIRESRSRRAMLAAKWGPHGDPTSERPFALARGLRTKRIQAKNSSWVVALKTPNTFVSRKGVIVELPQSGRSGDAASMDLLVAWHWNAVGGGARSTLICGAYSLMGSAC